MIQVKVDLFDFHLPRELIATHPARPRDAARLLHVGPELADHRVSDLPQLLRTGDLMIFNDTKVIPARLSGKRGTASVSLTLHKHLGPGRWAAFARPAKKLSPGDQIAFAADFHATVTHKKAEGEVWLDFGCDDTALQAALQHYGHMPLPPYIRRTDSADTQSDRTDYQTLFAREPGAVAAPTAGLHFTPGLMKTLSERGIKTGFVTLHVGAGTFLPVKVDDTSHHKMHSEFGIIDQVVVDAIGETRARGGRVVAVGTTALRLLESAASPDGGLQPFRGETDIFITPGYRFRIVDLLMTNFHLPRSTLFMLVSAFAGLSRMRQAYDHAIAVGYRFYSYGDACLIEPQPEAK